MRADGGVGAFRESILRNVALLSRSLDFNIYVVVASLMASRNDGFQYLIEGERLRWFIIRSFGAGGTVALSALMPPFFAAYTCTNAGRGSNMITTEKHFSRFAMRTVSLITD